MIGLQHASRHYWASYLHPERLVLVPYMFESESTAQVAAIKLYGSQYFEYVSIKPYSAVEYAQIIQQITPSPAIQDPLDSDLDKIEITPSGKALLSKVEKMQRGLHAFWMVIGGIGAVGIGLSLKWSPWANGIYADADLSFCSGLLMGICSIMLIFAVQYAEHALRHAEEASNE